MLLNSSCLWPSLQCIPENKKSWESCAVCWSSTQLRGLPVLTFLTYWPVRHRLSVLYWWIPAMTSSLKRHSWRNSSRSCDLTWVKGHVKCNCSALSAGEECLTVVCKQAHVLLLECQLSGWGHGAFYFSTTSGTLTFLQLSTERLLRGVKCRFIKC